MLITHFTPHRYKLKDSIHQDNYGHLTDEWFGPMIHYDKAHSVTFLDNHDTAGDLNDRFGSLEMLEMGYAFLLTHPGEWEAECVQRTRGGGVARGKRYAGRSLI